MSDQETADRLLDEQRAQRVSDLYQELAEHRDAVLDIEAELRALGEDPLS